MKATYLILLLEAAAFLSFGGCANQKTPPDDYTAVLPLPNADAFREVVRSVTVVKITYDWLEVPMTITVSDATDIAEIKNLLLSQSIAPHPGILGLGGEPVIAAFKDSQRLFDVRWQSPEKIKIFATEPRGWGGTYLVPHDWRTRYLEYCARMKQRHGVSKQPN